MEGVDPNQWKGLLNQATAGELYLDPEVGNGLDKVCDDHLDKLRDVLRMSNLVKAVSGMGTFNSGQALERKFSALATGNDRSLDTVIKQHIDSVTTMKEVVAKAIANYVALDDEHRRQIERMTPQ